MIGDRIRDFRKKAGLTQSALASLMKISPAAIGLYEQNRREPDLGTITKLSQCLNVTVEDLLELDRNNLSEPDQVLLDAAEYIATHPVTEEDPRSKQKKELFFLIDQMDEEQLQQINDYIEFIANKKK